MKLQCWSLFDTDTDTDTELVKRSNPRQQALASKCARPPMDCSIRLGTV